MKDWYRLSNIDEIDSPCLVIYKDRVASNIDTLVKSIDDATRLRPHIKTHKSPEVTRMMISAGISKYKCATISEAEMLAASGAQDILLAYQPVGPKLKRYADLVHAFPQARFACLVDNLGSASELSALFLTNEKKATVYIDLNVGMNRTGIAPSDAFELIEQVRSLDGIHLAGLHAYDGHIRDEQFAIRKQRSDQAFRQVEELSLKVMSTLKLKLTIVAGGTPTYSVHSQRPVVECSPGTFIYWDKGYESILQEQRYLHAAVVVTRIISKPAPGIICIDLGHKAIASENPLTKRVEFLNAQQLNPIGHSEEHMVLETNDHSLNVGDVLYGIPYHVCPTIALYERSAVAEGGAITDWWTTSSRNRKINI